MSVPVPEVGPLATTVCLLFKPVIWNCWLPVAAPAGAARPKAAAPVMATAARNFFIPLLLERRLNMEATVCPNRRGAGDRTVVICRRRCLRRGGVAVPVPKLARRRSRRRGGSDAPHHPGSGRRVADPQAGQHGGHDDDL